MIPVIELLNLLDTKCNRLANLRGQFIPNETKIKVLNIAQDKLVLKKVNLNNNYQLGQDSFGKRYEDLQVLQVPYEKLTLTKVINDPLDSYSVSTDALQYTMIVAVNGYVMADKGNCKGRKLDIISFMKHGDVRLLLKSPHFSPNFAYQETLASMSSDSIRVYSDETNSFELKELYLSYLRQPQRMDIVGYVHLDGTASTTVDCELEYYLENELVDLAVEEIADATANTELSQLSRQRTKENE